MKKIWWCSDDGTGCHVVCAVCLYHGDCLLHEDTMTDIEGFLLVVCVLVILVGLFTIRAAYFNGVVDGYGFSREPDAPGYADAGKILRKHMSHRWTELEEKKHETGGFCPDNVHGVRNDDPCQ